MGDRLVAIGEALIDFIPDRSGCEFREVGNFAPMVGGAPANVCGAFVKLGGKSSMLTQLGNDPFGGVIEQYLDDAGVDTTYLSKTDKANTALAFVSLGKDGNRVFSFYRNPSADMLYSAEDVPEIVFEDCYALHFCSVSLGDFPMKDAHYKAIEYAKKNGAIISFDPNLRFPLWKSKEDLKKAVLEFIPYADVLKISDEEIEFITGKTDIKEAAEMLLGMGPKLIIYTMGADGAMGITSKASVTSPQVKAKAVDTTGAGDGFIGSLLWKLHDYKIDAGSVSDVSEEVLKDSLSFANKFCAISVTKKGAINSYPTLDEVNNV